MTVRKVVLDGPLISAEPTGTQVHLVAMVGAMLRLRPDIQFASLHATRGRRQEHEASAKRLHPRVRARTAPIPTTLLRMTERATRLPRRSWLTGPYDIYHQLHTDADPAVPSAKLVVTMHDTLAVDWPGEESAMFSGARALLQRAAAVVTVSEFSKRSITQRFGVDPHRLHVVSNGVDHSRFLPQSPDRVLDVRKRQGLPERYVLFVGGATARKNLPRVHEAVRRARAAGDLRLTLLVVGPAADWIRARPSSEGWMESTQILGYVSAEDLPAIYAGAEVLLFPSLGEGFGLPVLEAMAVGTPVVTSNTTALPEVAGAAARLVDPEDDESILGGLLDTLSADEGALAKQKQAGFGQAAKFTWDAAAQRLLDVYESVASG